MKRCIPVFSAIWSRIYAGKRLQMLALEVAVRASPEVIFLDIGLPDIDGYGVAASLREHPSLRDAYLVALTGWGAERDRERSRAAGFDLHLTKPVSPEDLALALARS